MFSHSVIPSRVKFCVGLGVYQGIIVVWTAIGAPYQPSSSVLSSRPISHTELCIQVNRADKDVSHEDIKFKTYELDSNYSLCVSVETEVLKFHNIPDNASWKKVPSLQRTHQANLISLDVHRNSHQCTLCTQKSFSKTSSNLSRKVVLEMFRFVRRMLLIGLHNSISPSSHYGTVICVFG
jgi:hypothetical protein